MNFKRISIKDKGLLSVLSKTDYKCQLSVKFSAICQLLFWPFVSCQLSPSRPSSNQHPPLSCLLASSSFFQCGYFPQFLAVTRNNFRDGAKNYSSFANLCLTRHDEPDNQFYFLFNSGKFQGLFLYPSYTA